MVLRVSVPILFWLLACSCAVPERRVPTWSPEGEHVWRSPGSPAAYALIDGDAALLFGAPAGVDLSELGWAGITRFEGVYLTHAHRDSIDAAPAWIASGLTVRAPRACEPYLSFEGVRRYWQQTLPDGLKTGIHDLTFPDWEYLVLAEGMNRIDCSVEDGRAFDWRGWRITPTATPGHTRSHFAYVARRKDAENSPPLVFCGDALAAAGILWTPYTTDWDPSSDEGLRATAASLKKLGLLDPAALFPEHGTPILQDAAPALFKTAELATDTAFLKSYERYSKERVGNPPPLKLLAREQLGSDGRKPWSKISEQLFVTGSTYVVGSPGGPSWVVDPFGELVAGQLLRLQFQKRAGETELVTFTDAHHDHVSGVHEIPGRQKPPRWMLDLVASAVGAPGYNRTPGVHPKPVDVDRAFQDGEGAVWQEYAIRFHHLTAHTRFGSAIETTIEGKRCLFVGDAFLPAETGGGSGGWSGANGALPADVSAGVALLQRLKPAWVLASRGGAFEYSEADAQRRLEWAQAAGKSADRLSASGNHRVDWDPCLVIVEPFATRTAPGRDVGVEILIRNPSRRDASLQIYIAGRGITADVSRTIHVKADDSVRVPLSFRVGDRVMSGRHPLLVRVYESDLERPDAAALILDVAPR